MSRRTTLLLLLAVSAAGCPRPDPSQGLQSSAPVDSLLDYNEFVCAAQPVLIRRCSYLGCHGQTAHALRIYSPGKLRQLDDGTRQGRDGALTDSEVELNFQSAAGLLYGTSAAERAQPALPKLSLLSKPLRARLGGAEHHGVGVFPVSPATTLDADPEWQALVQWVGGAQRPIPLDAGCQQLFDLMGLRPR